MSFLDALDTSASGLSAQRMRMKLISSNLANINTTRTDEGGPYRRKDLVFQAAAKGGEFGRKLSEQLENQRYEVQVAEIHDDPRPPIMKFEPTHPDADAKGYVAVPNINVVEEMVNMISATRSYEANVSAVKATKEMASNAMEIGK
ncbi:MAG: flagellar basal body rod protein FlgC [Desulfatitalea sp.]|nr:flagellar basal body rod protein FlgC [Desulfatitalea sp.]NNJ99870.1 flagellar basal body rod protein FlgC [Desulfatitalea sp.]